jgi:outer membrane immunogenic protein
MIRNTVLGLIGAAALISSASAADMTATSGGSKEGTDNNSWTGLYAGVHVGGASEDFTAQDLDGFNVPGSTTGISSAGFFGGAQLGKNFQREQVVFGLEADAGGIELAVTKPLATGNGDATGTLQSGFYFDVTGRLGYLFAPNVLAYTKGGFALYSGTFSVATNEFTTTASDTFIGWTAGAGIEYAIYHDWTIKAEYQYFDFGGQSVGGGGEQGLGPNGNGYRFRAEELTVNTVSVGLNYRFSPSSEPLK